MIKIKIFLIINTSIIVIMFFSASAGAQDFSSDWSEPELLYFVTDGLRSNFLSTIADQANTLYAWWVTINAYPEEATADQPRSRTFHSQNIAGDWRSPMDVMIWPDAGLMTSVVIDANGILHAFSATDCLNYTTASHDQALSARGWTNNGCLDEVGLAFPSAVKTIDGTMYVVYSAFGNHSYRLIQSTDGGATWSAYRTILENQEGFLLSPMMAVDQNGSLHLVWSVGQAPDAYPPTGVFYTRSDDGGRSWTTPFQLGGVDEGEPAIAVHNNEVHVLWNGDAARRGRYYRYSPDAGESWSNVEALSPPSSQGGKGGLQRPPAIIVDNLGNVHALLHEQDAVFSTSKIGFEWSPKQALYNPELMKGVEVFGVRLAISGGNSLHAVYILESYDRSKSEDRRNHVWRVFHQSKEINALNEIPISWPTKMPDETDTATETQDNQELLEMRTALPPQNVNFNNDLISLDNYNPAWSLYLSVIIVSSFILLLLVFFFLKQRK